MKVKKIINNILGELLYSIQFLKRKKYYREVSKPQKLGEKIVILANGPSQKKFWDNMERFKDFHILVMNDMPFRDFDKFMKLQPEYYCFVDPVYLLDESEQKRLGEYFDTLDGIKKVWPLVSWKMKVVTWDEYDTPSEQLQKIGISRITNSRISEKSKHRLYRKNRLTVPTETVATTAIFFALVFGYKEIAVFGLDFDDYKTWQVDKNNVTTCFVPHSYDEEKPDACKIRADVDNRHYLYEVFEGTAVALKSFVELAKLASEVGAVITNYNVNSSVDAFVKKDI